MMVKGKDRGVTLLELSIVSIIVSILATVGIFGYSSTKERALGQEARAGLKLISASEEIYRMESSPRSYYPGDSSTKTDIAVINTNLQLSLTATNWNYEITSTADTFTATAKRPPGSGGYSDCQYSISQTQEEPVVASAAGTCP